MTEKILVVDDEEIIRESISFILKKEGYNVTEAANGRIAFDIIKNEHFDLVISDIEMPEMKGVELLEKVTQYDPLSSFIIITAYGSLETAINALRNGASDYILKPIDFDELSFKISKLFQLKKILAENRLLKRELQRDYDFGNIIGQSPAMQQIFDLIRAVSQTESTVLITGNSGTGKELIAKAIHYNSKRNSKPFIAVNCGAISDTLIESELFGHKKGAFTGALYDKEGFIKAAEDGTLFLDEITEMPLNLQTKFLRVIQEKEFTPVGTTASIPINIRFVATTNRNLVDEVTKGRFREDLYYRLNVVEIRLPSLSERKSDIPLLVNHFINKYRNQMGKSVKGIESSALRALINHHWKGEIRELENIIERSMIFAKSDMIAIDDIPEFVRVNRETPFKDIDVPFDEYVKKIEREFILRHLQENNYDKEKVAKNLNLGLSTLYRKIRELDIEA